MFTQTAPVALSIASALSVVNGADPGWVRTCRPNRAQRWRYWHPIQFELMRHLASGNQVVTSHSFVALRDDELYAKTLIQTRWIHEPSFATACSV